MDKGNVFSMRVPRANVRSVMCQLMPYSENGSQTDADSIRDGGWRSSKGHVNGERNHKSFNRIADSVTDGRYVWEEGILMKRG